MDNLNTYIFRNNANTAVHLVSPSQTFTRFLIQLVPGNASINRKESPIKCHLFYKQQCFTIRFKKSISMFNCDPDLGNSKSYAFTYDIPRPN